MKKKKLLLCDKDLAFKLSSAIFYLLGSDEDSDQEREWENQQIRKAVNLQVSGRADVFLSLLRQI